MGQYFGTLSGIILLAGNFGCSATLSFQGGWGIYWIGGADLEKQFPRPSSGLIPLEYSQIPLKAIMLSAMVCYRGKMQVKTCHGKRWGGESRKVPLVESLVILPTVMDRVTLLPRLCDNVCGGLSTKNVHLSLGVQSFCLGSMADDGSCGWPQAPAPSSETELIALASKPPP